MLAIVIFSRCSLAFHSSGRQKWCWFISHGPLNQLINQSISLPVHVEKLSENYGTKCKKKFYAHFICSLLINQLAKLFNLWLWKIIYIYNNIYIIYNCIYTQYTYTCVYIYIFIYIYVKCLTKKKEYQLSQLSAYI